MKKYLEISEKLKAAYPIIIFIVVLVVGWVILRPMIIGFLEKIGLKKTKWQKDAEKRKQLEEQSQESGVPIDVLAVQNDSLELAKKLGSFYDWWHPGNWFVYFNDAIFIVQRYSKIQYPFLAQAYSNIDMQGSPRDLTADLIDKLTDEQFDRIRHIVL